MCGEQFAFLLDFLLLPGSPPRVRGTEGALDALRESRGITPACAGNSYVRASCQNLQTDHPRVCGEQSARRVMRPISAGSPPRVRGTAPC